MRVDNFEEMVEAANAICMFFDDASKRLNLTDDEAMLWASAQGVVDNAGYLSPSPNYICEECANKQFGQDDDDALLGEFGEFSPTFEEFEEEADFITELMWEEYESAKADTDNEGAPCKPEVDVMTLAYQIAELKAVVKAMISA